MKNKIKIKVENNLEQGKNGNRKLCRLLISQDVQLVNGSEDKENHSKCDTFILLEKLNKGN